MFDSIRNFFKPPKPNAGVEVKPSAPSYPPVLVRMPDGRLGVIHHFKTDGNFGVRPITNEGRYFPNLNPLWTPAQRDSIPEEHALEWAQLGALNPDEVPQVFR